MLVICCSQLLVLVDCNKLHLRVGYCAISSDNRQYVVCENILTLTLAGGQPEWFYPEAEEALCDVGFAFECSQWGILSTCDWITPRVGLLLSPRPTLTSHTIVL